MRKLLLLSLVAILGLLIVNGTNGHWMTWYSFPELVAKADVIAIGRIDLSGAELVLVPMKFLKGSAGQRITVVPRGRAMQFEDGETALMFLEAPDGDNRAFAVGEGNQAKWPRGKSLGYNRTYHTSDMDLLERAVYAVKKVLAGKGLDERGRGIVAMLRSKEELIQLAGLEFALCQTRLDSLPKDQVLPSLRQLAAFALPFLESKNPGIRWQAIRLVGHAPSVVTAPALMKMISDPDRNCRRLVETELRGVFRDILGKDLPCFRTSAKELDQAVLKEECQKAWEENREELLSRDIPRLRRSLESTSELEKESAKLYLEHLGIPLEDKPVAVKP